MKHSTVRSKPISSSRGRIAGATATGVRRNLRSFVVELLPRVASLSDVKHDLSLPTSGALDVHLLE